MPGTIRGSDFIRTNSTIDGVTNWRSRFVLVGPSTMTLLSRIGSAEGPLFAFVQIWLACTLSFILSSISSSIALIGIPIALRVIYADRFIQDRSAYN